MKTLSRKLPVAAFSLTLLAAAMLPVAQPVQAAATGLQRCEGANGEVVYTDKACASFGAAAVPMSGELLTRIAYEEAKTFEDASLAPIDGRVAPSAVAPARRSAHAGCARTPTQLSMDLQGALALGDVNRVAESYHWVGMGHRQAQQVLARLDDLTRRPVVHAQYFNAQIGGALAMADASSSAPAAGGMLQVMFGEGSARRVVDFDVQRYAGCYFVRF
ncbi:hypothetical protein [Cognatilysobacter tabacisoli]|uniref:hypothetical protein n=1 Tax=Cognatilysobacter tabacisoli TaxID=2315424 RepID=UPI000E6B2CA0|nr:hypothetical protein [Lysobacter tabacisoli]